MKERMHMISKKFADHGKVKQWMIKLICFCLILTSLPDIYYSSLVLLAEEKHYEILSFSALPEEVSVQTVSPGTPLEALTLPNTLTASCRLYTVQNDEAWQEEGDISPEVETENVSPEVEAETMEIAISEHNDILSEGEGKEQGEGEEEPPVEPESPENTNIGEVNKEIEVITEVAIGNITWISTPEYDSEKEGRYIFTPILPENYVPAEGVILPKIYVIIEKSDVEYVEKIAVATQEELAKALYRGISEITLTNEITLTTTMIVPAKANIVLDGQGFSLKRGADENGIFTDTMLYVNGVVNAEDTNGSLTLTNICVDGQIEGDVNYAGSSAIIDCGNLILDEKAVVRSNFNYGTYNFREDGKITVEIDDYGGGIQVFGELTVTEYALVTENFANEFGGGVFLAGGSTLYLHADVIRENTVNDGIGYGSDLFAASGSTIYYLTEIDMTRDGFYLCEGVNMIGIEKSVSDNTREDNRFLYDAREFRDLPDNTREDSNVEIYLNIPENSGYTKEQITEITRRLEAEGYKVLTNRTYIDTTDLRDWYVYDHYDKNAWDALGENWEEEYGGNSKRGYYEFNENQYAYDSSNTFNLVYTIKDWMEQQEIYYNGLYLAQFKEHIYSRKENGCPKMTFAGYGQPAYVDFLFYNPESDGEKVVDFDVDISQVNTHTLAGNGFLVNTGIDEDGKLYGYLVYYAYNNGVGKAAPASLNIYQLNGISADVLHNNILNINWMSIATMIGSPVTISSDEWEDEMSIQIKATPTSIEVRQQPKESTSDIDGIEPIVKYSLPESKYSGFGPLVAYFYHDCILASSFTYSNLRMYFTNPQLEEKDILDSLERADFTQQDTQKYFINLLGNSGSEYNDWASFGQYQEYLKMMQHEGIALITDKHTPFENYLGDNLCELDNGIISVDDLIEQIVGYIGSKTTTYMEDKLQQEEGSLTKADPKQSIGNIWLKYVSNGGQVRGTIDGDSLPVAIQIMDNISSYVKEEDITYELINPNGTTMMEWDHVSPNSPPAFVIEKDSKTWPTGQYTVRQTISGSSICGYAYFDIRWNDITEPDEPDTFTISVLVSEGGTVSPDGKVSVKSGDNQSFIIKPNDGYQIDTVLVDNNIVPLDDLQNDDDSTNAKQYIFENVTSNHTLFVTFKEIKIVTADFYSGKAGQKESRLVTILGADGRGTLEAPKLKPMEEAGWTEIGWTEEEDQYDVDYEAEEEITLTENKSFYGIYRKDVTLSYDANGGTNAPEDETKTCYANVHENITYAYGDDTQFTVGHEATPHIENAIFIGWNDKSDGTGTLYKTGDKMTITKDTVLYAVYEVAPFATFYFGTAGNYVKRGVNLLTGNRTIKVPEREEMETMDMESWNALGFNREADDCIYGEDTLEAGTMFTLGTDDIDFYGIYEKDVTLTYAYDDTFFGKNIIKEHTQNYHANVHNEVTYRSEEGLIESYNGFKFKVTLGEADLNIPHGHKFAGWSADMENAGQLYQEGDEITVQEDTTLYAQWSPIEYEVRFDLNGAEGEIPATQYIPYGSPLQTVADPEMKGYSFYGWYKDQEGTEGNRWDFGKNVEQNTSEYTVTLYAKYVDDIAPVLGETSYNIGYKNVLNWIVRKKNLILTIPITEEGSGIKEAAYIMTPDEGTAQFKTNDEITDSGAVKMGIAEITQEDGQHVAKITVAEDFKGSVSLTCSDNAGNISPAKLITASDGGIIVEDNAPEIIFSSPDGTLSDYHLDKLTVNVSVEDTDAEENGRITGGISSISYRIDDGEETDVYGVIFQNAMVESCNFVVNITGEGEHTLSVTAVDHAGNENKAQISVYISGEHTYKVEHYKQNLIGDGYTRVDDETENLTGVTGSRVEAAAKDFTGFMENLTHESREAVGTVTADDSLVLRLYYDRITYEVDFDLNGMDGKIPSAQTVRYGGHLEKVENPEKKGYTFQGWYTEKEGTKGRKWDFDGTVENNTASRNITLYARCEDDIAPVIGRVSYNKGYKDIKDWIIRKKNLILTVPVTEEGSGVDRAEYVLIPEGTDGDIARIIDDSHKKAGIGGFVAAKGVSINGFVAAKTSTGTAQVRKEDGQYVAKITVAEDFKGSVAMVCTDKAGNTSAKKTITASGGGIIVENNAPEIRFSSKEGDLSDWFLNTAAINVTVEDDGDGRVTGGISGITYQIDGGKAETVNKNFENKIAKTCDFMVNISGEAEHTLKVTAVDNAGNENTASIKVKIKGEAYTAVTYQPENTPKSGEPKTGDSMQIEMFATLAMLSFVIYLLLYFFAGEMEMTEEKIRRLVSGMLQWKKKRGKHRVLLANVVIFFLLLYYYSIGRLATVGWKKVYEV